MASWLFSPLVRRLVEKEQLVYQGLGDDPTGPLDCLLDRGAVVGRPLVQRAKLSTPHEQLSVKLAPVRPTNDSCPLAHDELQLRVDEQRMPGEAEAFDGNLQDRVGAFGARWRE